MKPVKLRGGPNIERGYWQPVPPVMHMTARIEEIRVDAPPPAPPSSRRDEVALIVRGHRIRRVAGLAAISITLAATLVGPFAPSHSRAAASPAASNTAGPSASTDATTQPSATATTAWTYPPQLYTPGPYVDPALENPDYVDPASQASPTMDAQGWPVTLPSFEGNLTIGPDGTIYVDAFGPIGTSGHARPDWLALPDGTSGQPVLFDSSGTTYVLADDQSGGGQLWAFDSRGEAVAGWPVGAPLGANVLSGPSRTIYVVGEGEVTVFAATGAVRAKWDVPMPGTDCGQVVRPDGTLFLATAPNDSATDCSIRVYSSTGRELTVDVQRGWNGLAMASDGTVVAWGYDYQPYSTTTVARTRIAIVGPDGRPASGWPVVFEGTASSPAFGPDGTVYLTQLGLGTAPSRIVGLDRGGAPKPGWPVSLPAGYGPLRGAVPPAVAADGTIYIAAIDSRRMGYLIALDPTGAAVPGWPYEVPQAFAGFQSISMWDSPDNPSPVVTANAAGSTVIYLILDDRIVALGADGAVIRGWPFMIPAGDVQAVWAYAASDGHGGLVAVECADGSFGPVWLIRRWTSAGQPPR